MAVISQWTMSGAFVLGWMDGWMDSRKVYLGLGYWARLAACMFSTTRREYKRRGHPRLCCQLNGL